MLVLHRSTVGSPSSSLVLQRSLRLCAAARTLTATAYVRAEDPSRTSTSALNKALEDQTRSNGFTPMTSKSKKAPTVPSPSASVLLISPDNQVLLLQRVRQSSSFPSAHVFPGGNVSAYHDGAPPPPDAADRHVDSDVYRLAAIRETFEESGILLARNNGFGRLLEVPEAEREQGRKAVHGNQVPFTQWLAQKGGRADVDGLIPFTRWVTPTNVPKRFTTQMYLYFLPTLAPTPLADGGAAEPVAAAAAAGGDGGGDDAGAEVRIPVPTTDGGIEHTAARFLPAAAWCRLAQAGRVILFPPQFFLLHHVAQHLDGLRAPTAYASVSREAVPRDELEARRKRLRAFVRTGAPPWTDKCISPVVLPTRDGRVRDDKRSILGLHRPGHELEAAGSARAGLADECVLVDFRREGPRRLAVISRQEALDGGAKL